MVVPHEVPRGPRVFVNRLPDFARMDDFWASRSSDSAQVGLFTGLPGVGKTAFVRRCVQRIREANRFPGGDLHVDFGPVNGDRLSVADALGSCLGALGVAKDVLPSTLAERANRLRTITAHRQVLIVLEDVTEPAQVLPFLPNSPASAVLVTSNSRLTELELDGAEPIPLEPLDGEAGAHLLRELVGARAETEPEAVAELVRHCAGLPVALNVAAARLLARRSMSIDALVAQIAANADSLDAFSVHGQNKVAAVFSAAHGALSPVAARLYRLLGLFPGRDFTVDTAAVILDSPAHSAVDELLSAGLLDENVAQRFSLHHMVRRHAAHLSQTEDRADEREAALWRIVRHLLVKAALADQAVLGPGRYRCTPPELAQNRVSPFTGEDRRRDALEWLDLERGNLLAAQRAAADFGWHEESWQLAEALTALYVTRRYLVDWTASSDLGAKSAAIAGNARAEARLRSFVSRAWTDLGDLARAGEELVKRALPIAEGAGDARLLASVWELIGRFRDETDFDLASEAYERAIALFTEEDDARGVAFVTFFLGCSQRRSGRLDEAAATLHRALPQIRAVGDTRMEGRCLTQLGAVAASRELLGDAIEVLRRGGDQFYEASAHEELVALAEQDGDGDTARSSLTRMLEIHQALGSDRVEELIARLERSGT